MSALGRGSIPWRCVVKRLPSGRLATVVEGDLMELDSRWESLPNHHPHDRYSSIESINRMIADNRRENWHDAESYEQVARMAQGTGREDVTEFAKKHLASPQMSKFIELSGQKSLRPIVFLGDEGDEVDMDRMRAGEEDVAWRSMRRIESKKRSKYVTLEIVGDVAFTAGQSEYVWNGVQAAVLADILESYGYRVEINWVGCACVGSPGFDENGKPVQRYGRYMDAYGNDAPLFINRVRMKRFDDPVRLDLLAYQFGCIATFRVLFLNLVLSHSGEIPGHGLHGLEDGEKIAAIIESQDPDRRADHVLMSAFSRERAVENIKQVLADFDITEDATHAA